MHKQNSDYGHKAILASACGMLDERPIWGVVQHGWSAYDGWSPNHPLPRGLPRYVWSRNALDRMPATRTRAPYHVIGSPFAYLMRDGQSHGWLRPARGREVMAFPLHSSETTAVVGNHAEYAERLRTQEGRPISVCLYWLDYQKPELRDAYVRHGHRVTTLGTSRRDRLFIPKWLRLLDGVGRVVSNRLCTAVVYAAALDVSAQVYGDAMHVPAEDDPGTPGVKSPRAKDGDAISPDWARKELGFDSLRSPQELRDCLGWSGVRLATGGLLDSVLTVRSVVRSRRLQEHYDNLLVMT